MFSLAYVVSSATLSRNLRKSGYPFSIDQSKESLFDQPIPRCFMLCVWRFQLAARMCFPLGSQSWNSFWFSELTFQHVNSSVRSISLDMPLSGQIYRECGSGQLVDTNVQETMFFLEMGQSTAFGMTLRMRFTQYMGPQILHLVFYTFFIFGVVPRILPWRPRREVWYRQELFHICRFHRLPHSGIVGMAVLLGHFVDAVDFCLIRVRDLRVLTMLVHNGTLSRAGRS